MNLTTTSRALVAALALTGGLLGFASAAQAATPGAAAANAVTLEDGPEPLELDEEGLVDLLED
ncbi:hypothetical protein [Streptomyces sp. NPDC051921]|uniref:hypothetical protein n=1 Tax=Streptomyces sp. NPDC051921 TaxID=3155806 RepID=UPI003426CFCB